MSVRRALAVVAVLAVSALVATSCSDDASGGDSTAGGSPSGSGAASSKATTSKRHAVGRFESTYVDTTRGTRSNGDAPEKSDRTLKVTYFYPATGDASSKTAVADAPSARRGGPYPLLEFSHGYTGDPDSYKDMLTEFAAAGYVVAAPWFPLTSSANKVPDGADYVNQPEDASFVITKTIEASAGSSGPLAGMVDPKLLAAGGQSHGGVTTAGIAGNSCCLDKRLKAALVMAGSPYPYPKGTYDFVDAPPLLFVHGTKDDLMDYQAIVRLFNKVPSPRGLLTLVDDDHSSWIARTGENFDAVVDASLTFLDAYVKGDAAAKARLAKGWDDGKTKLVVAVDKGQVMTLPTTPEVKYDRKASITPDVVTTDGQEVTVHWSGYLPGGKVNIVQCSNIDAVPKDGAYCELTKGKILIPDATGTSSVKFNVILGTVGKGECGPGKPRCVLRVLQQGVADDSGEVDISLVYR